MKLMGKSRALVPFSHSKLGEKGGTVDSIETRLESA